MSLSRQMSLSERASFVAERNTAIILSAVVACGISLCATSRAAAQSYPSRPITMVVPYPPGGPLDAVGRIVAEGMKDKLRQPVVIQNIGGASGSIGTGNVARAAPDGYTVGLGSWPTHVLNAAVYNLPYDVLTGFEPVGLLTTQPVVIVARKDLPANDLRELIAWLKANPGKASAGGAGAGSANHLSALFFQKETGTQMQFVPYRGGALAMQDLLAGQIDLIFDLAASAVPQVRAGTIKAYAVMAKERLPILPEVPTVDEAGLQGLYVSLWFAQWAPKGTSREIITELNAALRHALADPNLSKRLANLGQTLPGPEQQTPESLEALQKAEIAKWWPIVKAANIKPN
jgi:tripartite-type tricarboxylate transporter receptor subunit TctC